jgi:uncharacterized protein YkwD
MRSFFLPTKKNNYSPAITKSTSIMIFAVLIFVFNSLLGNIGIVQGQSSIDANQILILHNRERESNGLGRFSVNTLLNKSAQAKAQAMLDSNCWSHYCPNGKSPWDFFDAAGYTYIYAGENLAQGFFDNESVMQAWMNSPTHRENILKPEFNEVGIGIAYGDFQGIDDNIVITVHFGSRSIASSNIETEIAADDSGTLGKPEVFKPEEGAYTNDKLAEVSGEAKNASEVEVIHNTENKGRIIPEGGLFTYRPQSEYEEGLQTFLFSGVSENGILEETSDPRNFYIDSIKPEILDQSLRAKSIINDTEIFLTLEFTSSEPLNASRIEIHDESFLFKKISSLKWEVDIPKRSFDESEQFTIQLIDLANNDQVEELSRSDVLGIDTVEEEFSGFKKSELNLNPFNSLWSKISDNKLSVRLNLIFILFTLGLIIIDIIALKKTGLTGFKGKPHLHFASIFILLVVIVIGGINGAVLTGISLN